VATVDVPASFNFPHTGKLLSLSFVLFAGWFADAAVPLGAYPRLALAGLLSFFGSLNAAVPFLLDTFRIPADTFQLFLATSVINARFGTLVAVVHTLVVALLGSAAVAGAVRFDGRRILRYAVVTVLLAGVTLGGLRIAFTRMVAGIDHGAVVYGMTTLLASAPAPIVAAGAPRPAGEPVLAAIRRRGALRVAFIAGRLPYSFENRRGELVGLGVELAHLLARDLDVPVQFVRATLATMPELLASGDCDLAVGGNPVTPGRLLETAYSAPFLDETMAFLVKDHLRARFETWAAIDDSTGLRVAAPDLPYYLRELKARAPRLAVEPVTLGDDVLRTLSAYDAVLYPAERGAVLTLLDPQWTVVVPQPNPVKVPIAFPLARRDAEWKTFVDAWIGLKQRDDTLTRLYDHWILGKDAAARSPRWSVIRNVLHWTD
jgi:ABC-type amino acid transport substrate-binding protein